MRAHTHTPLAGEAAAWEESTPQSRQQALGKVVKTLRVRVIIMVASEGWKTGTMNESSDGVRGELRRGGPGSKVGTLAQNLHLVDHIIHTHSGITNHH